MKYHDRWLLEVVLIMTNPIKTYVYTFTHYVKQLCRFITKHQGVFLAAIRLVVTNDADYAVITSMVSAIVAGCAVLDKYYPQIPA